MGVSDLQQKKLVQGSEDSRNLQEQAPDVTHQAEQKSHDEFLPFILKEQSKLLKKQKKKIERLEATNEALLKDKRELTQKVYSLSKAIGMNNTIDEDIKEFVYLDEYEEVVEENEALKKRLIELRAELSNTKNLLKRAANGKNVTVSLDEEALKKKDETIEALKSDFNEMRSQWATLDAQFSKMKKENEKLIAEKDALQKKVDAVKTSAQKKEKQNNLLGLTVDQWKAAYLYDQKHAILTPSQQRAVKKAITHIGIKYITLAEEGNVSRALQALKAHGFNPDAAVPDKDANDLVLQMEKKKPEPTSMKTPAQKLVIPNDLLGLSVEQWKEAYSYDLKHAVLSSSQQRAVRTAISHIGRKYISIADEGNANRALQALKAHGFDPDAVIYDQQGLVQQVENKSPKPIAVKSTAPKNKVQKELVGLSAIQWKAALDYNSKRNFLSATDQRVIMSVLRRLGTTYITTTLEGYARGVLIKLKAHGFDPSAILPVADNNEPTKKMEAQKPAHKPAENNAMIADVNGKLSHYKRLFQSLNVSTLFGTPAPHKPILLIAIMNLIERGYYHTSVIMPGAVLEGEFDTVWKSLVPKDCKYSCNYWTSFWYMRLEPFWTIVPKSGCSVDGKDWLSEKEAKSMITGARLDENLFQLMQSPAARKELKQALIEKYLTNK